MCRRILIVHEVQVKALTSAIIDNPMSNKDVSTPSKHTLEITPIKALHPDMREWTLKVRVLSKNDLRSFNNSRGPGHVFGFDVNDIENTEIHITCFNIQEINFHPCIDAGKIYIISKGSIKPTKKEFNHLKNDWEISLGNTSTIELFLEDEPSIPQHNFAFTPINELPTLINNSVVDIIGVDTSISPLQTIMRENGTDMRKRNIKLKDMSSYTIEVT